jgi:multisubunit Na+/H+ antiporter MnhB subunit
MSFLDPVFDGLLAVILIVLAVRILTVANLFHAVALFIAFGLLMAMTWVRLAAPDVALAEAGIGAALTGVLLVDALHNLSWSPVSSPKSDSAKPKRRGLTGSAWPGKLLAGLAAGSLWVLLLIQLGNHSHAGSGLAEEINVALPHAGVSHPVTAVLLNFRSFDTLLELAVLFLAVIGVLCVRGTRGLGEMPVPARGDIVVEWLLRVLLPLLPIVAVYLLWLGSFSAGGAFQAGIIVAAGVVLLWLTGRHSLENLPTWVWKLMLVGGLAAFSIAGATMVAAGREFLEYPSAWASGLILFLEMAAALSIGAALAAIFLGLHPPGRGPEILEEKR